MPARPVLPKLVGQRVKRREDPRLIQGGATYVDDVKIAGMQYVQFKRSDIAHGRIRSIDVSAAREMEGVEAVFTGKDIAAMLKPLPIGTPFTSPPHYAVAIDAVRYGGEAVAVVVASDRYVARDAADAIVVDYEPLPAVIDPELAMEGKPAVIYPDFPNNLSVPLIPSGTGVHGNTVDDSAIDKAFAEADVVVRQRMHNHRLAPSAMEPRGVVAHWEPSKAFMTIWSSTQNPHILRTMIAGMLGVGESQVRAIAPEVGGGFGAKINIYPEEYVVAAVSKRLGLPLKWIEERSEAFVATTHGRGIIGYLEMAAKQDGRVTGVKLRLIADIGAYNMLLTAAIPTLTMMMANATYDFPAIRTTLTEVFSNKTPTDAYRGAGRPEATYFIERGMDLLARELNMDPADLRRRNFIAKDKFPFHTQTGAVYDSGDYEKALDAALEAADWEGLKQQREAMRREGRIVGLGLAMYVEVCGLGPSAALPSTGGWEHSQVTVERDGRITATTGVSPHGQGNETTFAQMLADQFGVPLEHVTILHGDTGVVKQGIGTFGSRSQAVGGTALHLAGTKVKAKMAKFAAAMLEAHEDDIVFESGQVMVKGAPASAKTFSEIASFAYVPIPLPEGMEPGLSEEAFFEPTNNTYPFGCHIVMLEIDRDTGEPTLLKVVAVDDAGNLINPLIVEGQIHGGLAQGIGQAMIEEVVYGEDGQLLTGSFMDYALPRAIDFPRFELHATVTPTPVNPFGAKGVGEAGTLGSTPAMVAAASDALGVAHIDMMLRPEKLWRIIQGQGGQHGTRPGGGRA
jgi:carbon-monoxide dehydrogenase large subunit